MDQGKLRSLMFHAGFCNEDGGWDSRPICEQEHDNFQRFAELIVRECVELSVNSQYANTKSEYYEGFNEALIYAGNKIKQHFGVEE